MKTKQLSIFLLLLIVPVLAFAGEGIKGKYKREKKMNKSYAVNPNASLGVKNKYGNVFVTTWDENKIAMDIVITVTGNDEQEVIKRINNIDVSVDATRDNVTAITKIDAYCSNNTSMEINYTIKIPKQGAVNINNHYGNTILGKINGETSLSCKYGDIKIEELNNRRNVLDMEYCGSARIGYLNTGKLQAKYSDVKLDKGGFIDINSEYTNILLTKIEEVTYKSKYGDINIVDAENVFGVGEYMQSKIGTISGKLNLTTNYGDINIQSMSTKVNDVYISTSYTTTKIGYAERYPFDFEISLSYGDLQGTTGFNYQKKEEKNTSGYYKGYNYSPGKNRITIKSKYGDIKFIKR